MIQWTDAEKHAEEAKRKDRRVRKVLVEESGTVRT